MTRLRTTLNSTQENDIDYEEGCPHCDGEGFLLVCWDDVCQGQGYCMHGDGEVVCMFCQGAGE